MSNLLLIPFTFIYLSLHLFVGVCMPRGPVEVREQCGRVGSSLLFVASGDGTRLLGLTIARPYPLIHLIVLQFISIEK